MGNLKATLRDLEEAAHAAVKAASKAGKSRAYKLRLIAITDKAAELLEDLA